MDEIFRFSDVPVGEQNIVNPEIAEEFHRLIQVSEESAELALELLIQVVDETTKNADGTFSIGGSESGDVVLIDENEFAAATFLIVMEYAAILHLAHTHVIHLADDALFRFEDRDARNANLASQVMEIRSMRSNEEKDD